MKKEREVVAYLNVDKYINLLNSIEQLKEPTESDLEKFLIYQETLTAFIDKLSLYGINNQSADEIFKWYITWENYISNLNNQEYRIFINSRITNMNLEQFNLEDKKKNNEIIAYSRKKHQWFKNYLNKNYSNETEIKEKRKIKEV